MTQGPASEGSAPETGEDYSYDLAHEAQAEGDLQSTGTGQTGPGQHHESTYVATETADHEGDYSYDLAHDLPPSPER